MTITLEILHARNDFLESDIARAILSKDIKTTLAVIKESNNVNRVDKFTGNTYLHYIVTVAESTTENRFIPMIYQLSNAGINTEALNSNGLTAFQLAVKKILICVAEALLRVGIRDLPNDEETILKYTKFLAPEFLELYKRYTPGYWQAVNDNNWFRVNKLVKCWCRINIEKNGVSLVEFARKTHNDNEVKQLIENEASIELVHAAFAGDLIRMKALLCHENINIHTQDYSYRRNSQVCPTPLELRVALVRCGLLECAKLLDDFAANSKKHIRVPSNGATKGDQESSICIII